MPLNIVKDIPKGQEQSGLPVEICPVFRIFGQIDMIQTVRGYLGIHFPDADFCFDMARAILFPIPIAEAIA